MISSGARKTDVEMIDAVLRPEQFNGLVRGRVVRRGRFDDDDLGAFAAFERFEGFRRLGGVADGRNYGGVVARDEGLLQRSNDQERLS